MDAHLKQRIKDTLLALKIIESIANQDVDLQLTHAQRNGLSSAIANIARKAEVELRLADNPDDVPF